jgi:hypothetical protein
MTMYHFVVALLSHIYAIDEQIHTRASYDCIICACSHMYERASIGVKVDLNIRPSVLNAYNANVALIHKEGH